MGKYTISVQDIKNYLASKQEDEVIGEPMDGGACLAHNTLVLKYSLPADNVSALSIYYTIIDPETDEEEETDYPEDVERVVDKFDSIELDHVTKSMFRERVPELFEEI